MKAVLLSPDLGPDRIDAANAHLSGKADVLMVTGEGSLVETFRRADAYLCVGFAREFPVEGRAYERLRFVQAVLAGVDHLPFDRLPPEVIVCGNAGAYNTALAEHAFALLLAGAKRVVQHAGNLRRQKFDQGVASKQLRSSTLGVLGLGGIGKEVARLGRAFGMRVIGITRRGTTDVPVDWVGGVGDLDRLLAESDFLVIAVPHTKETHHLLTAKELARMKPDAVLVNIARGELVKEDDLYRHLKDTPSFVAASDVWWRYPRGEGFPHTLPFHELPNFFGTPHVAWNVPPQRMIALDAAAENVLRYMVGEAVRNRVDRSQYEFPKTAEGAARADPKRVG